MPTSSESADRYCRQTLFAGLGQVGQARLGEASAVLVGVGGLGSWIAELLARAGVGRLRLIDSDRVDWTNLHRQAMYTQADARQAVPKAAAAGARIAQLNADVRVEPIVERLTAANASQLLGGADVIVDGTDNFATRFLINDFALLHAVPWVFGGVVRAEGQVMTVPADRPGCLRCVYPDMPPPETVDRADTAGVIGPAVATIASLQAAEAMKILAGLPEAIRPHLLKLDLWTNRLQTLELAAAADPACPCCVQKRFDFL